MACRRGRMVSAALSSALRTMELAGPAPLLPSGNGAPVLRRAHRSSVSSDLPRPGSPSRIAGLPRARRPGQSQATARGVSSLTGRSRSAAGGVASAISLLRQSHPKERTALSLGKLLTRLYK